jgi:hypothetical protein
MENQTALSADGKPPKGETPNFLPFLRLRFGKMIFGGVLWQKF